MVTNIPIFPVFDWNQRRRFRSNDTVHAVFEAPERIWTVSGEAAIFFALRNADLKQGDTILVPTYHCPTMIRPARHLGLDIRFYPLAYPGYADLDHIEACFRSRSIRAILLAHYFGFPQPVRQLRELCDAWGVVLIEDCAHALFGVADDAPLGSWGDYAIASLSKFLPLAWGGCLVSHRKDLSVGPTVRPSVAQTLTKWLDVFEIAARHGRPAGISGPLRCAFAAKNVVRRGLRRRQRHSSALPAPLPGETVSTWFDLASAMAAPPTYVGQTALGVDHGYIRDRRRQIFRYLADSLSGAPGLQVLYPRLDEDVVPYVFPVISDKPDLLFQRARAQGLTVFRWDRRWPGTPSLKDDLGTLWSDQLLQLPCQQSMSDEDVDRVVAILSACSDGTKNLDR